MNETLVVTLCKTRTGAPLAVVDGLPGGDADLTPAQLRALAAGLLHIAADAEAHHSLTSCRRCEYPLNAGGAPTPT